MQHFLLSLHRNEWPTVYFTWTFPIHKDWSETLSRLKRLFQPCFWYGISMVSVQRAPSTTENNGEVETCNDQTVVQMQCQKPFKLTRAVHTFHLETSVQWHRSEDAGKRREVVVAGDERRVLSHWEVRLLILEEFHNNLRQKAESTLGRSLWDDEEDEWAPLHLENLLKKTPNPAVVFVGEDERWSCYILTDCVLWQWWRVSEWPDKTNYKSTSLFDPVIN